MKNFTLCLLAVFAVLVLQPFHSFAQLTTAHITQNPTYPCDDSSSVAGGGSNGESCIHVCVGDTVQYHTDEQGTISMWEIFAPGGGTIIGPINANPVTVVWNTPGQYIILVTVQTADGQIIKDHQCIQVEPGVTAVIGTSYTPNNGCINVCNNTFVTFNNLSFSGIISGDWDFGDGFTTTSTGASSVTHQYTAPGTYTVVLTAHSACCSDTAHYCVTVDALSGPDIFCISPVCGNTNGAQYCTGASCTSYNWIVNGGTIATQIDPCITVNWGAGPVGTISLQCNGANVCPQPTVVTVPIMPNGPFNITGPIVVCQFSTNNYAAPYVPGAQYTWTITDPTPTTNTLPASSPPYLQTPPPFNQLGTYILTCHMSNDVLECEGDATLIINVLPDFSITGPDTICAGSTGTFNATQNFNPFNCDWTTSPSVGAPVLNSSSATFTFNTPGTYTVIATPLPGTACSPQQTLTVVVQPAPAQPAITPNPLVCPGTPYTYTASGSGPGVVYNWTATGGITFNNPTANPVTANIPNIFSSGNITVTPVSNAGCPGPSATINVTPYATPSPSITGPTNSCPDVNTTYNISLSYPGVSSVNVTINPANAGVIVNQTATTVDIKWFVISPPQATITITETICGNLTGSFTTPVINILPLPTPTASATSGCNGVNTILTATGGASYSWFLATGGPSLGSGSPLSTPYVAPGNYYVIATGANGCSAKAFAQAASFPEPVVSITGPTSAACDPATGLFSPPVTLSTPNGPGYLFAWSNGANTFSTSVNSSGTYTVTVTSQNGCIKTQSHTVNCACGSPCPTCVDGGACDINGNLLNPATLTAPAGNSYLWSPGGQTTQSITTSTAGVLYSVLVTDNSNVACPQVTYSFYLHCTGDVCPYSGNPTCTANTPTVTQGNPMCNNFTFQTNTTCVGTASWNFGDGSLGASGNTVTHNYTQIGTYQVCYGFTGNPPCDPGATACTTITVPVAANFSALVNCNMVQFTDLSNFLSGSISAWNWSFGDPGNNTSTQQNPTFTYPGGGTYNVTLTVTVGSCQAQITLPVTIVAPSITASITTTACNAPIIFTATDNGSNPPVVSWSWNFGDATSSTLQNPTHTFPPPGPLSYNVTVTATSGAGCTTTASGTVSITPPPPPFNLIYTSPGCGNVLIDAGGGYTSYQWFLNGNAISGETNQTHTAVTTGNYYCVVTTPAGCIVTSNIASIVVNPLPVLNLTAAPQALCSNQLITLYSGLSGNYTVKWLDNNFALLSTGFTYAPGLLAPGSYTYNVTAIDLTTFCQSTAAITIVVGAAPTVSISNSNPAGVCGPNPITLTATGNPPTVTYLWSNGAVTPAVTVYSGGLYTVTVTDPANGCMASATDNVIIFPLPDLSMLPIGCDSACDNPVTDTIHGPPGLSMYEWQVNGVPVATTQNLGLNPGILPLFGVPYTIKLIATTVNGCVDSTTFQYTAIDCDSSDCYTLEDTTWCNGDGTFSFQFKVHNNNAETSASILLDNFTAPFLLNGLPYYVQFLNIPPNGNSGWMPATPLILSNPTNLETPATFCFHSLVVYGDTCCYDSLCVTLPNCDPCANISASAASDSADCCQSISITNNFVPNYFSGVQVVPITVGTTIASTTLGPGGIGWASSGNGFMMSFYPPGNSTIPVGTINDLFTLCLNLSIGTPNPQYVLLNWFVPGANETDSIVCQDTLVFHCDPPLENPCGTITDTIVCTGDGTYQYTFTLTNNSPNPIPTAVIDVLNPQSGVTMPIIYFFNPPILPDSSATQTTTITTSLPAGSVICYHMTLLDSIGCCCHAIDTVCFTLPDCDTVPCSCGGWDLFTMNLTPTDATLPTTISHVECGANMPHVVEGSTVTFTGGGYHCNGDSACTSQLTWSIPGATPSSGTGLPSFTFTSNGPHTLTLYGSCGGHLCDSCTIHFVVDTSCHCGSWNLFSVSIQQPPPNGTTNYPQVECGANYSNLLTGTVVNFTGGGYTCNGGASCASQLTWNVTGGTPSSGTGLPSFTLNGAGTSVLTIYSYCGGNICDSCKITFHTVEACVCGSWQPFSITTSNVSYVNQPCGGTYSSKTSFPITLNGTFNCIGSSCNATYSWTIYKSSVFFLSGTTLPITFTPTQKGVYQVVISAMCGGHDCETCTFTFNVKTPASPFAIQQDGGPNVSSVGIKASPNPVRDVVTLHFSSDDGETGVVEWFNELGVSLKQRAISWKGNESEIEMNVSDLPSGIYYVRFTGENGSAFTKVIVYR